MHLSDVAKLLEEREGQLEEENTLLLEKMDELNQQKIAMEKEREQLDLEIS